ncbi:integral membrane protein [Colletotrichum abscissum]|uniref:Integral membrane protein n=1 Tax=Colletotrichum abscissum TaxID=1671311 RepID=A0A9P9X339_9PEZI|nr:integral membrane protein [Colletotrichum abscissum]
MDESKAYGTGSSTSQSWLLLASSLAFGIGGTMALLTLVARLAVRYSDKTLYGASYTMLLAWVLSIITQSIVIVAVRSARLDLMYTAEAVRLLSHSAAEISIAWCCLNVLTGEWLKKAGRAIIAVIFIYTIVLLGLLIFRVTDGGFTERIRPEEGNVRCLAIPMAATAAGIITDIVLVALPVKSILQLNMTPTKKRRAILRWCSPVIPIFASAVRLFFLSSLLGSSDPAMHDAVVMVLMFAEVNLTIICGNLPATLLTIKKLKSKVSSETMAASGSGGECSTSHAPRGLDEFSLQSRDETERPWTGNGDDSSQRGMLATHSSTV